MSEWLSSETQENGEKGTLVHYWWECKLVQSLWKARQMFLENIKNRSTVWSCNSTPGYIFKKRKNNPKPLIQKDTCIPMFMAALFTIAKI